MSKGHGPPSRATCRKYHTQIFNNDKRYVILAPTYVILAPTFVILAPTFVIPAAIFVIPAQAGIQIQATRTHCGWILAYAGMTGHPFGWRMTVVRVAGI